MSCTPAVPSARWWPIWSVPASVMPSSPVLSRAVTLPVQAEINDWCKAAQVRRRFRDTNLAQIGRPYPGMMDLYIDETNLYNRMWLYTKQFDWEKMWAIADNITDEDAIRAKAQDILDTFDIEGGGTVEKVWDMAPLRCRI